MINISTCSGFVWTKIYTQWHKNLLTVIYIYNMLEQIFVMSMCYSYDILESWNRKYVRNCALVTGPNKNRREIRLDRMALHMMTAITLHSY